MFIVILTFIFLPLCVALFLGKFISIEMRLSAYNIVNKPLKKK